MRPKLSTGGTVTTPSIRHVVILGGGTAGWMTATYLRATFGERVAVTLVESERVGTIGVGEATFSTIRHFFEYLGLSERDWMPACNASYKLAIRFEGWTREGGYFYHPFERLTSVHGFTMADWWLALGTGRRFDQSCFLIPALCDGRHSPRYLDGRLFEDRGSYDGQAIGRTTLAEQATQFPYAYHFDAALLAGYLRRRGERDGVRRIGDDMVGCERDERGWITGLKTREHGTIEGDLFVDCSGFRGLLLNGVLEEPFHSYQESLPNDRAVALRVPVDIERDGIPPYTAATAQEAGWIWTIPLYGRHGVGYVYASDFSTPERAEQVVRDFVGDTAGELDANHIKMRIGRNRRSWVANCVAIGLSSGFVEPLESTGIFFIQHGIEQLVKHFPGSGWDPALRRRYNASMAECQDGVREFLVFHYYGSSRVDTPYWQATKQRELPRGLAGRVTAWKATLPEAGTIWPRYHGFEAYSYVAMLLGLGRIETRPRPALLQIDPTDALKEFVRLERESERLCAALPGHHEYLMEIHGEGPSRPVRTASPARRPRSAGR